jgi:hypothetical protein
MKKYLLLSGKEYGEILEKNVVFKGSHQMGRIKLMLGGYDTFLFFEFSSHCCHSMTTTRRPFPSKISLYSLSRDLTDLRLVQLKNRFHSASCYRLSVKKGWRFKKSFRKLHGDICKLGNYTVNKRFSGETIYFINYFRTNIAYTTMPNPHFSY